MSGCLWKCASLGFFCSHAPPLGDDIHGGDLASNTSELFKICWESKHNHGTTCFDSNVKKKKKKKEDKAGPSSSMWVLFLEHGNSFCSRTITETDWSCFSNVMSWEKSSISLKPCFPKPNQVVLMLNWTGQRLNTEKKVIEFRIM